MRYAACMDSQAGPLESSRRDTQKIFAVEHLHGGKFRRERKRGKREGVKGGKEEVPVGIHTYGQREERLVRRGRAVAAHSRTSQAQQTLEKPRARQRKIEHGAKTDMGKTSRLTRLNALRGPRRAGLSAPSMFRPPPHLGTSHATLEGASPGCSGAREAHQAFPHHPPMPSARAQPAPGRPTAPPRAAAPAAATALSQAAAATQGAAAAPG